MLPRLGNLSPNFLRHVPVLEVVGGGDDGGQDEEGPAGGPGVAHALARRPVGRLAGRADQGVDGDDEAGRANRPPEGGDACLKTKGDIGLVLNIETVLDSNLGYVCGRQRSRCVAVHLALGPKYGKGQDNVQRQGERGQAERDVVPGSYEAVKIHIQSGAQEEDNIQRLLLSSAGSWPRQT